MVCAWRIVGCNEKHREIATLYFYHAGTWNILAATSVIIQASFVKELTGMTSDEVMTLFFSYKEAFNYLDSHPPIPFFIQMAAFFFVLLAIWGIPAWRAYRDTYKASWSRSSMAFFFFLVGSTVVIYVFFAFVRASLYCAS